MNSPKNKTGATILIVDDDPVTLSIMESSLTMAGFSVRTAADGIDACRQCDLDTPDMVVVDAMMPQMDGFEFCRELRQRQGTRHIPILMATGLEDTDSIDQAYEAGATDFISKPLNWVILAHRIRYMLRAARAFEDLRENQTRLRDARDAAEAASRAKSDFLANMSHELRTPLNAIIGFSSVMEAQMYGTLDQKYREYAETIGVSGNRLLSVIDEILEFSQADNGSQPLIEQIIEPGAVIAKALESIREMAKLANIALHEKTETGLPKLIADPAKIEQMLNQLLSNAVKFTPPDGRVQISAARAPRGGLHFRIEDNGAGIPENKIALALSPFGQIESSFSRSHDGIGLGLPMAQRIAEQHGGTMDISSAPGKGTAVTIHLPAARCQFDTTA